MPFQGSAAEIIAQQTVSSPPSLCEKVPELPIEIEQIIMTALSKDPQQRFASV